MCVALMLADADAHLKTCARSITHAYAPRHECHSVTSLSRVMPVHQHMTVIVLRRCHVSCLCVVPPGGAAQLPLLLPLPVPLPPSCSPCCSCCHKKLRTTAECAVAVPLLPLQGLLALYCCSLRCRHCGNHVGWAYSKLNLNALTMTSPPGGAAAGG